MNEQELREQIAKKIEAKHKSYIIEHDYIDPTEYYDTGWNDALKLSAAIARGQK